MGYGWIFLGEAELPEAELEGWLSRVADSQSVCAGLDLATAESFGLCADQPEDATVREVLDELAAEPGALVERGARARLGVWVDKGGDGWGRRDALVASFVRLAEHGGRGWLVAVGDDVGPDEGFRLDVGDETRLARLDLEAVREVRASRAYREVDARLRDWAARPSAVAVRAPVVPPSPGSYLEHVARTVAARAFPDARDGLKRVHRQVLWTLHLEGPLEAPSIGARATARFGAPATVPDGARYLASCRSTGGLALVARDGERLTLTPLSAGALASLASEEPERFTVAAGPEHARLSLPIPWLLAGGAQGIGAGARCDVAAVEHAPLLEAALERLASPPRPLSRRLVDGPQAVLDDGGLASMEGEAMLDAWIAHRRATLVRRGELHVDARIEQELRALLT